MVSFKKLASNGSKVVSIETFNHFFDALYLPAVALLGALAGGVLMTVSAIALNFIFVQIYNQSDNDWYGFEWMRSKLRTSKLYLIPCIPYFIFWCWWDPFAAFIFIRGKQGQNYKFKIIDWLTLGATTTFGSTVWVLMTGAGITIIKRVIFG